MAAILYSEKEEDNKILGAIMRSAERFIRSLRTERVTDFSDEFSDIQEHNKSKAYIEGEVGKQIVTDEFIRQPEIGEADLEGFIDHINDAISRFTDDAAILSYPSIQKSAKKEFFKIANKFGCVKRFTAVAMLALTLSMFNPVLKPSDAYTNQHVVSDQMTNIANTARDIKYYINRYSSGSNYELNRNISNGLSILADIRSLVRDAENASNKYNRQQETQIKQSLKEEFKNCPDIVKSVGMYLRDIEEFAKIQLDQNEINTLCLLINGVVTNSAYVPNIYIDEQNNFRDKNNNNEIYDINSYINRKSIANPANIAEVTRIRTFPSDCVGRYDTLDGNVIGKVAVLFKQLNMSADLKEIIMDHALKKAKWGVQKAYKDMGVDPDDVGMER